MTATRTRPPTTGPHECKACGALAYSNHAVGCRKGCGLVSRWWLCPNEPRCQHAGMLHDIDEYPGDGTDTCCVDGCDCRGPLAAALADPETETDRSEDPL